jgi:hypothetical protein
MVYIFLKSGKQLSLASKNGLAGESASALPEKK